MRKETDRERSDRLLLEEHYHRKLQLEAEKRDLEEQIDYIDARLNWVNGEIARLEGRNWP